MNLAGKDQRIKAECARTGQIGGLNVISLPQCVSNIKSTNRCRND